MLRHGAVLVGNCLVVLALLAGCGRSLVGVNVQVVDETAVLEQQVLGTYEGIGKDVMLMASVRAVDEQGRLKESEDISRQKRKVLAAMQSRQFNRDDVIAFKAMGVAGENNEGYLTYFPVERTRNDPQYEEFVKAIIAEENRDRRIIMERIVAVNEALTETDVTKVGKVLAHLNRDNAQVGESIQLEDGTWVKKQ